MTPDHSTSTIITSDTSTSDDEPLRPNHQALKGRGKGKGKGKGMSVLRPTMSKFSGNRVDSVNLDGDGIDNDEIDSESMTRSASHKRKLEIRSSCSNKPRKRRASRDASVNDDDDEDGDDVDEADIPTPLPLRYKNDRDTLSSRQETEVLPVILSSPLPSLEPNEPGGTWLCQREDCMHRVYGADTSSGRDLVKDHISWHAEKQGQIELIKREARPHLPVRLAVNLSHGWFLKDSTADSATVTFCDVFENWRNSNNYPSSMGRSCCFLRRFKKATELAVCFGRRSRFGSAYPAGFRRRAFGFCWICWHGAWVSDSGFGRTAACAFSGGINYRAFERCSVGE